MLTLKFACISGMQKGLTYIICNRIGRQTWLTAANGKEFGSLASSHDKACGCYDDNSCVNPKFKCNCDAGICFALLSCTIRIVVYGRTSLSLRILVLVNVVSKGVFH